MKRPVKTTPRRGRGCRPGAYSLPVNLKISGRRLAEVRRFYADGYSQHQTWEAYCAAYGYVSPQQIAWAIRTDPRNQEQAG